MQKHEKTFLIGIAVGVAAATATIANLLARPLMKATIHVIGPIHKDSDAEEQEEAPAETEETDAEEPAFAED